MTTALVLAGTRPGGDPFAKELGVEHKSLIEIGGETILQRVIVALKASRVDRIVVSADHPEVCEIAGGLGADLVAPQAGPSASVARAFEQYGAPMLVTTSDHALLQPQWVDALIADTPLDADISLMLAEKRLVEAAVPGVRRTYLRFADGHWSGCNLFYLRTPDAVRALETWSHVEQHRKRPWRIAARLGFSTLASMAIGRLTLADGVGRLGQRMGLKAALVPAQDGLAAVDVDKIEDLRTVEQLLKGRNLGTFAKEN